VPAIQLIAGLGNPGLRYEPTRHNAGAWFVDRLALRWSADLRSEARFSAQVAQHGHAGDVVRLARPVTYMNESGLAIAALTRFYRIPAAEILIVHDDVDLEPGIVRLKHGGGHGGHNGLRDIISRMGGERGFYRLRIGVGHPGNKDQVVSFVLNKPTTTEQELIDAAIDAALDTVPDILAGDMQKVMQDLHSR